MKQPSTLPCYVQARPQRARLTLRAHISHSSCTSSHMPGSRALASMGEGLVRGGLNSLLQWKVSWHHTVGA